MVIVGVDDVKFLRENDKLLTLAGERPEDDPITASLEEAGQAKRLTKPVGFGRLERRKTTIVFHRQTREAIETEALGVNDPAQTRVGREGLERLRAERRKTK